MTTLSTVIKPEIAEALDEIRATFANSTVEALPNSDGSAWVSVSNIFLGEQWEPSRLSVGFTISFQYPYADCYPHYVSPSLKRVDGTQLPTGIHAAQQTPRGESAVMISRCNPRIADVPDTAAIKLIKVIEWMRVQ